MLYRVGTAKEIPSLRSKLPDYVVQEIINTVDILDMIYGAGRNYLESGGYFLIAETGEDVYKIRETIDYDTHLCEWADWIGPGRQYISALYIINNDFAVNLFIPTVVAPKAILKELED